jgi:hypothetical protein
MTRAYMFQAELLCEGCGDDVKAQTKPPLGFPDESLYDSDDYPKGPYSDGGGEADTPQHCGHCGAFLGNPLTPDGDSYVRENAKPYEVPDSSWETVARLAELDGEPQLAEWIRFYFAWGQ